MSIKQINKTQIIFFIKKFTVITKINIMVTNPKRPNTKQNKNKRNKKNNTGKKMYLHF